MKMVQSAIALCVASILVLQSAAKTSNHSALSGHQVWLLGNNSIDMTPVKSALKYLLKKGNIDIFGQTPTGEVKFRVYPDKINATKKYLTNLNLFPKIEVENVASFLQNSDHMTVKATATVTQSCTNTSCPEPLYNAYMTFDQMGWYLSSISKLYPSIVNVTSLGLTVEGRKMWLVKIKNSTVPTQKAVWIEGGIHAREWIASAVALHMINYLLKNPNVTQGIEFNIAPMVNPDGFVYTKTTNRLWRKNRAKTSACQGVDLNRNWQEHWGVAASTDPCSEVYQGTKAFSELETIMLSKAMTGVKNLTYVLSLHSYSQLLLYPWGWTTANAPNKTEIVRMGSIFSSASNKINKVNYAVTNTASGLYLASGTTQDWAAAVLKVLYSYTLELRDTGTYGFLLPSSQINATAAEVWAGFKAVINEIKNLK